MKKERKYWNLYSQSHTIVLVKPVGYEKTRLKTIKQGWCHSSLSIPTLTKNKNLAVICLENKWSPMCHRETNFATLSSLQVTI